MLIFVPTCSQNCWIRFTIPSGIYTVPKLQQFLSLFRLKECHSSEGQESIAIIPSYLVTSPPTVCAQVILQKWQSKWCLTFPQKRRRRVPGSGSAFNSALVHPLSSETLLSSQELSSTFFDTLKAVFEEIFRENSAPNLSTL